MLFLHLIIVCLIRCFIVLRLMKMLFFDELLWIMFNINNIIKYLKMMGFSSYDVVPRVTKGDSLMIDV